MLWVILGFVLGTVFGFFIGCLLNAASYNDSEGEGQENLNV
jgi:hypothetical protein